MQTVNGSESIHAEEDKAVETEEWIESTSLPPAPELEPPVTAQTAQPKKRGRKPYPRDSNGNILRPDGSVAKGTPGKQKAVSDGLLSDADVGKAISGAFMVTSIPLGGHWRLFPHEIQMMGEAFGPLARRYPDQVKEWIPYLMLAPTVAAVALPRIMVQGMIAKGELAKENGRKACLQALVFMKAEESLDIERQAKEAEEVLRKFASVTPDAS